MDGVERVVVGYTGGKEKNPTYQNIKDATESVLIEYNPSIITYETLLHEFSKQHYPYSPSNSQYKSAIFFKNEEEQTVALAAVKKMEFSSGKICYTDVEEAGPFYRAEEYHQDFLKKQKSSRTLRF